MLFRRVIPALVIFFTCIAGSLAGQQETKKVFNKLVLAIGNSSVPKPVLLIKDNAWLVAKTFPSGEVFIGKQFISYCSRFGADSLNALACVLSHELVHYYQKHFWAQKFGSAYVDNEWGRKISEDENSRKFLELYETQADQLGFYYAFSAGYKTWKIASRLLDSTYAWFRLKDSIPGYPSLPQRKALAETSSSKFAALIPVFEMSNHLKVISATCLGDQQSAILDFSAFGYEHLISANIQTAEMYNNLAVAKILKAQKFSSSLYAGLQLPVMLDQSSLMYEASGTKGDEEQEKFDALMGEALELLDKALKLDEYYWPASVNKSIVLLGQGKYGSCEDELNSKAIQGMLKTNKSLVAVIAEIRGVSAYLQGDKARGKTQFAAAQKAGSGSAKLNEQILQDMNEPRESRDDSGTDTAEKWNGKMVYKGLKSYKTGTDHVTGYSNSKADLLVDSTAGYKIFELRQKIGFCPVQYVKVAACYQEGLSTSKGIRIGSSQNDVIKAYGKSETRLSGTVYGYLIYPKQSMVITIDHATGQVNGWFYYMMN